MYRKVVVLAILLLLMVFIGSCAEKRGFRPTSKPLTELEQKQGAIDALADLHNQVQVFKAQAQELAVWSAWCDSVAERNQELEQENAKLKAQLAQARDEVIPAMRRQYEDLFAKQQFAIQQLESRLERIRTELYSTQSECSQIRVERDQLQTENDQLKPWASKWKHDAHRSFIKVMLRAGKAPIPDFPEPQLE